MSLLSWFYGTDAEAERGRQLDAQIEAENLKRLERGIYADEDMQRYYDHRYDNGGNPDTYAAQVDQAADEGWKEGKASNVSFLSSLAKRLIEDPAAVILASVPWYIWAGIALYLGWQLGLFQRLFKK